MTIIKKAKLIPWTNPYASANLIAMWDGIWNSGRDIHLPDTEQCIDLINGRILSGNVKGDNTFIISTNSTFNDIDLSHDMTIEWLLDDASEFINDLFIAYSGGICYQVSGVRAGYANYQIRYWNGNEHVSVYPLTKSVCAAAIRYANGIFTVFRDGKELISYDNATAVDDFQHVTIGRLSAIRCLRFYSRALSNHETLLHYTLDHDRFKTPT